MRIPGKNSINININLNGGSIGGGSTTVNSRVYSSKGIIGDGTSSDPIKINTVENSGLKFDDNNKVLVDTDLIATGGMNPWTGNTVYVKGENDYAVTTNSGNNTTEGYLYNVWYQDFANANDTANTYTVTVAAE